MEEKRNYERVKELFQKNGGFLTREDIDQAGIPSWFLSEFVRKNDLTRLAPGFYASQEYPVDEYFLFQRRYPKYIFSGLSALYLLGLTERIPTDMEVAAPRNYHPIRQSTSPLVIHRFSNPSIYELGIKETKTMFGNVVRTYDEERTVCDLLKHRNQYDSEVFVKAIYFYLDSINDQIKLFEYAKVMGIENKAFETLEVVSNGN